MLIYENQTGRKEQIMKKRFSIVLKKKINDGIMNMQSLIKQ
ncbi:unnamed protein product [Paramecium sonneborni]|uniref:Uncharacterized protein n=1 Tax=Paramecium sonneborni TaxID=65129 RepID=A0A8S1RDV3_9CILI|nr:unnamed protein product [Paramecium sonneborni]